MWQGDCDDSSKNEPNNILGYKQDSTAVVTYGGRIPDWRRFRRD